MAENLNNTEKNKKTTLGRQKTLIIILAALAAVLGALYAVLVNLHSDYSLTLPLYDEDGDLLEYMYSTENGSRVNVVERTEDSVKVDSDSKITYSSRPFMFPEVAADELVSVKVENSHGEYEVYLDTYTGEYLVRGGEMLLYDAQQMAQIRFQSRYTLALQKIEGRYTSEESLSPFGLSKGDNPASFTVTSSGGDVYKVYIGNMLLSGDSYYARLDGKPFVYVVDTSLAVFFDDEYSLYSPIIAEALTQNEYQYMEEFDIDRFGQPFIKSHIVPEDRREGTGDTDLHKLSFPASYSASLSNYYDALASLQSLSGTKVIEKNVLNGGLDRAAELFEKYGFDNPSNDVYYKVEGKESRFLTGNSFTSAASGKTYYAYSEYMDTIVLLPVSSAPFLDYELMDFIDENVFQMNIKNVSQIDVKTEDASCRFVLEGEGSDLKVTELTTGLTVDASSFRQFFISLLSVKIEGYAAESDVTGSEELSFTVRSVYGEEHTYTFSTISTTRALITLDSSSEFYTNRSYVTAIAERLLMLLRGEKIEANY